MAFCSATLIDGDEIMVIRGLRVVKELEGTGFYRVLQNHMDQWAKARQIYRKITLVTEKHVADITKPSRAKWGKHILTQVHI